MNSGQNRLGSIADSLTLYGRDDAVANHKRKEPPVLRQVAEGVWIHAERVHAEQRRCRARPRWGVARRTRGDRLRIRLPRRRPSRLRASPLWRAFRRIRIGIICSGTPGSAKRRVTVRRAARLLSRIGCRTRGAKARVAEDVAAGNRRSDTTGPARASSPVCPPKLALVPWDGPRIRIVEHQAHAPGHAALLIEDAGISSPATCFLMS